MGEVRPAAVLLALVVVATSGARAATFTVINANASGGGSLAQAILDANGNGNAPTVDLIDFAIPGAGVHTITLGAGLPISAPVTIDASTQPGTTTLPLIELVASTPGIVAFGVYSDDVTIRGFVINGFAQAVYVNAFATATVVGNFIGTDPSGASSPNAANQSAGIYAAHGSLLHAGGSGAADGNVIASYATGIYFEIGNGTPPGSTVEGNFIGVDRAEAVALGNGRGINVLASFGGVTIRDNVIAHSTSGSGVLVCCNDSNRILDNSFYANVPSGIDLTSGPFIGNNNQVAPTLTAAWTDGLATRLTGSQAIPPSEQMHIQLFSNPVAEEQGRSFVGEIPNLAASPFDVTFPVGSTPGHFANGTVTRLLPGFLDTSAFSNDVEIAAAPLLAKAFVPAAIGAGSAATLRLTLTNLGPSAMTGVSLTDTYPPGLLNANPPSPATTCGGAPSFGASAGAGSFTAAGLTVPGGGSCEVTVLVTAPVGSYTNTVPAGQVLSAANGASLSPASATLQVSLLAAPTVTKSFTPASIAPDGTSTLTLTLTNPNATPITGVAFTDTYPSGLVNAATPAAATTCTPGVATAPPGPAGNTLALSGGTIPANGSCTVSATVTAAAEGVYINDIPAGAVTSDNAASNSGIGSTGNVTVAGGVSLVEVPTLGSAALALLVLLLAAGALLALRQQ